MKAEKKAKEKAEKEAKQAASKVLLLLCRLLFFPREKK